MSVAQTTTQEKTPSPAATAWSKIWARLRPTTEGMFGMDLRAVAALRIGLAFLILIDLIGRSEDLEVHYTNFGVMPFQAVYLYDSDNFSRFSPYMWVDGVVPVALLMILAGVLALMLLFGWKTRLAAIGTYFMLAGIQSRNPMILTGADLLLRVMMFWAMWLPLGARWSLDGTAAQLRREGRTLPKSVLTAGTAAFVLQIAFMYWFAALSKNTPEWRRDGTAVYYALSIEHYATPFGQWLRTVAPLLKPMTFGTICLEAFGPFVALFPWKTAKVRLFIVPVFMTFHLILLNLCLDLGPFPYVATLAWVPFLPTSVWDWFEKRCVAAGNTPFHRLAMKAHAILLPLQTRIVDKRVQAGKRPSRLILGQEAQIAAGLLILYVFVWNVRGMDYFNRKAWIPQPIEFIARMLRLDQGWGMFAPRPMIEDGWYVMPAKLMKDSDFTFDIYTKKAPVDWEKPVRIVSMYPSERWRKYLMNLFLRGNLVQRQYYASWVCRHWNRAHEGGDRLDKFRLIYMEKDTKPNYARSVVVQVPLWEHACFGVPTPPTPPPAQKPGPSLPVTVTTKP